MKMSKRIGKRAGIKQAAADGCTQQDPAGAQGEVLLSVVTAVYNTAPFLREMIDSVLAQDLTDLEAYCARTGVSYEELYEFILVDDGSTDESAQILDSYAARDPRIRVLHRENKGASAARNAGIAAARGKYITFPDSDDRLSKTVFRDCLLFLEEQKEPVAFAAYPMRCFDAASQDHWTCFRFAKGTRAVDLRREWDNPQYHVNSAFFRLCDIQGKLSFETGRMIGEDTKFIYELIFRTTPRIGLVSTCSYGYRKRSAGEQSAMQASRDTEDFYIPYVRDLLGWMLRRAEKLYKKVPKYVQYAVMGQLQWRLAENDRGETGIRIIGASDWQRYKEVCLSLLAYIDGDVILAQKQIWSEHFCYIFRQKYQTEPELIYEEDNLYYQFKDTRVPFGLADIYTRIDSLQIADGVLQIEGCSMNYDSETELVIYANGEPAAYGAPERSVYKYCFDDSIMYAQAFAAEIPLDRMTDAYSIRFCSRLGAYEVVKIPMRYGWKMPLAHGCPDSRVLLDGWIVGRDAQGFSARCLVREPDPAAQTEPAGADSRCRLSVIIPVYNAADSLRQTLDSVLGQSLREIEVICVDDGSEDDSLKILREYEAKDSRIRVLWQEHQYAGPARNQGIEAARGEYIHFLDADDTVQKHAYASVYYKAKKYGLDVLRCGAVCFDTERGEAVRDALIDLAYLQPEDFNRLLTAEPGSPVWQITVTPWAGIYRREFLLEKNIRFNDLICVNDRAFFAAVITNAKRLMITPDRTVVYRARQRDSLVGIRAEHFDCHFRSIRHIRKRMRQDGLDEAVQEQVLQKEFQDMFGWARKYISTPDGERIREEILDFVQSYDGPCADNLAQRFADTFEAEQTKQAPAEAAAGLQELVRRAEGLITARIDVKNEGCASNDIALSGLTGHQAKAEAPAWYADAAGIGYVIQAQTEDYAGGRLSFTLWCLGSGSLLIRLRGMSVRDRGTGERIPCRIDYLNMQINGREALARPVCVCHDTPFNYRMDVTDGESVQVDIRFKSHAAGEVLPVQWEKWDFDERRALRIDLTNTAGGAADFEWLQISDPDASLLKPAWFNRKQNGYMLTSDRGKLNFTIRCVGDGTCRLSLKGIDKKDKTGKRIPLWIDCRSLQINEEYIFTETKSLWHNAPYTFTKKVTDGDILRCSLEWAEHTADAQEQDSSAKEAIQEQDSSA